MGETRPCISCRRQCNHLHYNRRTRLIRWNQPLEQKTVMVMISLVNLRDLYNGKVLCRVLLGSGSQMSFILRRIADRLEVQRDPTFVQITGAGVATTCGRKKLTVVAVQSRYSDFSTMVECLVIPKGTRAIPKPNWINRRGPFRLTCSRV